MMKDLIWKVENAPTQEIAEAYKEAYEMIVGFSYDDTAHLDQEDMKEYVKLVEREELDREPLEFDDITMTSLQ